MNYNSVAQIYEDIDDTREKIFNAVEKLEDGQRDFRPSPEKWSVAQIVEHLSIVEGRVVKLIGSLLEKAEAHGHTRSADAPFAAVSIAEQVEQTRAQKLDAPEQIKPTGAPLDASLAALRETRAALRALRPRVELVDGTGLSFPHPVWGAINLYQWLAFVGAHERRHLAQIEALKNIMSAE